MVGNSMNLLQRKIIREGYVCQTEAIFIRIIFRKYPVGSENFVLEKSRHTLASIRIGDFLILGPIEEWFTLLTVDTMCVVEAVLTHPTTFSFTTHIQRQLLLFHLFVVYTFLRVTVTVAFWDESWVC